MKRAIPLILLTAVVLVMAVCRAAAGEEGGAGGLTPGGPGEPEIVGLFFSGYTGGGDGYRNAWAVYAAGDWERYIAEQVEPAIAWARASAVKRRIVVGLHNPFGILGGEVMQPTQYLDAQRAGLYWLTDDYVPAWRAFAARHPDVVVMAYTGKASASARIRGYEEAGRGEVADWVLRQSDRPMIAAGQARGIDALADAPRGGVDHRHVQRLLDQGTPVLGEITPRVGTWQDRLPSLILYERMEMHHGPGKQPPQIFLTKPTWNEVSWPLYVRPGVYVVCKWPAIKTARAMGEAARWVRGLGCVPLIQARADVLAVPIDELLGEGAAVGRSEGGAGE